MPNNIHARNGKSRGKSGHVLLVIWRHSMFQARDVYSQRHAESSTVLYYCTTTRAVHVQAFGNGLACAEGCGFSCKESTRRSMMR